MSIGWKSVRSIALVSGLAVPLAVLVLAQTPDSRIGTWKLNVAKSKFSPGPAPKSGGVTFSAAGQETKVAVETIGPDGSKINWEYTATTDGSKPYPVKGNPDGDMVVAKRIDPNTVETSYTLKGKPTTVNTAVVSADGKTLTVTSKGTNGQGQKIDNVQVFEKA